MTLFLFPVGSFEGSLSRQSEWGLPLVHSKAAKLVCRVPLLRASARVGFAMGSPKAKLLVSLFWSSGKKGGGQTVDVDLVEEIQ